MLVMRIILLLVVLGGLTLLLALVSSLAASVFGVKVQAHHWQYGFCSV